MSESAVASFLCPACEHENELPYLLCEECGEPRAPLSRWRVTWNITLAFTTLLASFHFRDLLAWNWPLYLLFAIYFTQFTLYTAALGWRASLRFNLWFTLFLGGFFGFFFFYHREQLGIVFLWLADLPEIMFAEPWVSGLVFSAILLAIFGPAYVLWGRRHGWVNSYRLVLLSVAAASVSLLGAFALVDVLHRSNSWPDGLTEVEDFLDGSRPVMSKYLAYSGVRAVQVFVFEIFIFSALRGVAVTRRGRHRATQPHLQKESAFVRSAMGIAVVVNRLLDVLESMVRYLLDTLWVLTADLLTVVAALLRETVIPALTLSVAGAVCYRMTFWFESYVVDRKLDAFVELSFGIVVLLVCALVFVGCKTRFRSARIVYNLLSTLAWLLPNLLLFFLLLSFFLWASSRALNHYVADDELALPFRMGALTQGVAALLLVLIVVVFVRKRSQLFAPPEPEGAGASPSPTAPSRAAASRPPQSSVLKSIFGGFATRVRTHKAALAGTIKERSESLGIDKHTERLKRSSRDLTDWLKGKPPEVKEFEAIRDRYEKRTGQLRGLEQTRNSISSEMYETMRARFELETDDLRKELDLAQSELDRVFAEQSTEKYRAALEVADAQKRLAEIQRLSAAGALDPKETKAHLAEVTNEIRLAEARIDVHSRRLAFLSPYASPLSNTDQRPGLK